MTSKNVSRLLLSLIILSLLGGVVYAQWDDVWASLRVRTNLAVIGTTDLQGNVSDTEGALTIADNVLIDGAADTEQLTIQGNSTQTSSPTNSLERDTLSLNPNRLGHRKTARPLVPPERLHSPTARRSARPLRLLRLQYLGIYQRA